MTMPDLWTFASAPTVDLLGWTLLHFVWQGALLATLLAGALYLLRNHAPRVRHAVSCAALLGLLAFPVGTALVLNGEGPPEAVSSAVVEAAGQPVFSSRATAESPTPGAASWPARATVWVRPVLPWLVLGWGLGVLFYSIRLAGGAWRVRWLRRASTPPPAEWQERLHELAERMGLRRSVALRRSDRVESPVVAGWWCPVVLVPTGLLSGLPPAQVEALLLHELAHVRRHDVLVGRLQAVVETLFFFHPATWWVSQQVREAREACCDDLAVRVGANRTVYARALAAMAERAVAEPSAACAPAANNGSLLARIRRLLSPSETPLDRTQRVSVVVALVLTVGVLVGLVACTSQQSVTGEGEQADTQKQRAVVLVGEDSTLAVVESDSTRRSGYVRTGVPCALHDLVDGSFEGEIDTLGGPISHDVDVERLNENDIVLHDDTSADTLLAVPSGQIVDESKEQRSLSVESAPNRKEGGVPFEVLLRRARQGNTHEIRSRALEALAESPYSQRAEARRLFRERARESTATDLERWRALDGLGQQGGPRAVQVLEAVQENAQNPELKWLAGRYLDRARTRSTD